MRIGVLGVDLSLTGTGLAGPYTWDARRLNTSELYDPDRMIYIRKRVMESAVLAKLVVLEDFSYGSKGRGVFQTGGLGWVVRVELAEHQIPYVLLPPNTLKGFATGKGNVDKYAMRRECERRLGIVPRNDDEADACWLRAAGCEAYGILAKDYGIKMPGSHRRFLEKVTWPELSILNSRGDLIYTVEPLIGVWA